MTPVGEGLVITVARVVAGLVGTTGAALVGTTGAALVVIGTVTLLVGTTGETSPPVTPSQTAGPGIG